MFTDTTYFDIFYDEPCDPVNQLPTMSAATGISGSFVSGGINYRWHSISTNSLPVIPGQNTTFCPNALSTIFTVENMGNICDVQLLIVGGGGGGGYTAGGGGGGGQVVYVPNFPIRRGRYCCTRGDGGAGNQSGANSGSNGNDSTVKLLYPDNEKNFISPIFTITARGGGGGGSSTFAGGNGGSKGTGGGGASTGISGSALFSTSIYYNGKDGGGGPGGGGGGATTTGSNGSSTGGNGGAGIGPLYMTGSTGEYYGGGGGGGNSDFGIKGFGGIGGGGNGAGKVSFDANPNPATGGTDFLGGGGGGGFSSDRYGAPGGKGTVIITYKYQLD